MRILHLITDLAGGGAERQLSYLAPALTQRGHDVHIGYSRTGQFPPAMPGVVLEQFASFSSYDPLLMGEVARLAARVQPDIIHTWILQMDVIGGAVATMKGIPWVLREPSSALAYRNRTWKERLRVQVARNASAIVCNSRGGDDYWQGSLPTSRRYTVPNGLPVVEIDAVEPAVPAVVPNNGAPIVLYVGRLSFDCLKHPEKFLQALALVREQVEVTGVLCGEGPQREELMVAQEATGITRDLFTGNLAPDQVWALMKKAAVFVSLSEFEGCPNTVMEAMAAGCSLVLSDIPAHREIADESCATFVDLHDTVETANSILRLLHDPDAARAKVAAAKAKAQEWSVARMLQAYERIYQDVR